jgi:hypothetical protein
LRDQILQSGGNLVLMLRGDLLRRYPNTIVVAFPARTDGKAPSGAETAPTHPVFAGRFDPDVSFFGFPLTSAQVTASPGWFFALMEPVTEPRFGFDETLGGTPTAWTDVAWQQLGVGARKHLTVQTLTTGCGSVKLPPAAGPDHIAAALFQRPFQLVVHAKHLIQGV